MSFAILSLCGIDAPQAVAASLLNALFEACNLRQPIGRFAILVSPETARLVRRIELVDEWHAMKLHGLAARLARQSGHAGELLIVAIGDDEPRFHTISLAPVAKAFNAAAREEPRKEEEPS